MVTGCGGSRRATPTGLAAASVGERWMHRRGFRPSPAAPAGPRHLAGCARMRRNRFYLQRDAGAGCAGGSVPEALCAFKRSCDTATLAGGCIILKKSRSHCAVNRCVRRPRVELGGVDFRPALFTGQKQRSLHSSGTFLSSCDSLGFYTGVLHSIHWSLGAFSG